MKLKTAVKKHQVNQRKRALKAKKFNTNNAVKNSAIRPQVNEIEFDEESSEGEVGASHQELNKWRKLSAKIISESNETSSEEKEDRSNSNDNLQIVTAQEKSYASKTDEDSSSEDKPLFARRKR